VGREEVGDGGVGRVVEGRARERDTSSHGLSASSGRHARPHKWHVKVRLCRAYAAANKVHRGPVCRC
jgi:hypothetical protein